VIAATLAVGGLVALVAGALLVRRPGTGFQVGRLLAAAPRVSLDEAIALAHTGEARYVRTHGRIASDEEFPDEQERPLVYRRRRLQALEAGNRWRDVSDERLAVPFGIEDRQTFVGVDVGALGDGLVVVPRVATGTAGDLPAGAYPASDTDPGRPIRLRIEQVSAVEHASVAGVPTIDPSGAPMLSAGLGRPLILTTLEPEAAMRLLASGRRGSVLASAALLVGGLGALAAALVAWVAGL
jgi:hypothetical protein